jgi:hypothetical protein
MSYYRFLAFGALLQLLGISGQCAYFPEEKTRTSRTWAATFWLTYGLLPITAMIPKLHPNAVKFCLTLMILVGIFNAVKKVMQIYYDRDC